MAKLNDESLRGLFQPHLQPGETLLHAAYGVKQPPFLLIVLLMFLGILPGVIATAIMTKHYAIGLTNRRFLVLRLNSSFQFQEITEYDLNQISNVKGSVGPIFTHIQVLDPQKPFIAKFHRAMYGLPQNRQNSIAIAEALTKQKLTA